MNEKRGYKIHLAGTSKMNGHRGHKIYLISTPEDPLEAELLRKQTEGRKRPLLIRWVKAEDGQELYPPYQAEVPVGLKISVMVPLDYSGRDRWPEYDMALVTMPDRRLELLVRYRKVSILEFDALEKKFTDPSTERLLLYYPPVGAG